MNPLELVPNDDRENLSYDSCKKTTDSVFATFCQWTERLSPLSRKNAITTARLNHLPLIMFDKEKSKRAMAWIQKDFEGEIHIPFKNCIVADPIGVVVLEHMQVINRTRLNECFFMNQYGETVESLGQIEKEQGKTIDDVLFADFAAFMDMNQFEDKASIFANGSIAIYNFNEDKSRFSKFLDLDVITEREILKDFVNVPPKLVMRIVSDSIGTAVDQLQYLAQPGQYVIQETPRKVRQPIPGRVVRSHERKRIVILDPEEMKKIYRLPSNGHHASPIPHLRMGHWRHFEAAYYKEQRGKKIWIEEIKVRAGYEWELDGRTYKVMERG